MKKNWLFLCINLSLFCCPAQDLFPPSHGTANNDVITPAMLVACILRSVSAQLSTPLPSSPTLANFLIGCLGLHLGGLHRKAVNALLLASLSVRAEPLMSRAPPPSFIVHVCILQTFSEWQPSLYVCPPEPAGKMQIVCKKIIDY